MRQLRKSTMATLAGLGALAIAAAPGFADGRHGGAMDAAPGAAAPQVQFAHMGGGRGAQGQPGTGMMGPGQGYGPGPGYGMGPGQGCGPGQGYGMGSGYGMGPGMMGPGYGMGPGQGYGPGPGYGMGPGMMGPGYGYGQGYGMGPGMTGPGQGYGPGYGMGPAATPDKDLSADDVRARIEGSLTWHGNKRVKVGEVTEADDDTIVAEIVTQDGSLVQRFKVDRHTGQMQQAE